MPDQIEPALTPDEWRVESADASLGLVTVSLEREAVYATGDTEAVGLTPPFLRIDWSTAADFTICHRPEAILALANAALQDSDPRKITREVVFELRSLIDAFSGRGFAIESSLWRFAHALESYLPPDD